MDECHTHDICELIDIKDKLLKMDRISQEDFDSITDFIGVLIDDSYGEYKWEEKTK